MEAACWVEEGGEREREKETPPVDERVAGDSLSLEKSEGGAELEVEVCGTAKEWGAEEDDEDEGWGCEVFPFEELCR